MKIILITAPRLISEGEKLLPIPSLGMANIAAFIKYLGHDIVIDDLDVKVCSDADAYRKYLALGRNITQDQIDRYLQGEKIDSVVLLVDFLVSLLGSIDYDLIGFSISDRTSLVPAKILAYRLKHEGKKVIAGGSSLSREDSEMPMFDKVFIGRDVESELANFLGNEPIKVESLPKMRPCFDGYPFKRLHSLSPLASNSYEFFNPGKMHFIPYQWSWNCPHSCSFCNNSLSTEKAVIAKDIDTVVEEITYLKNRYDSRYFFMLNEYSHISPGYSRQLFAKMRGTDIIWCGACRCDMNSNIIEPMYSSGCRFMCFGFESASPKVLKEMNKSYDIEAFKNVLKTNTAFGVWNALYILVGFPTETDDDFRMTFDFIRNNIDDIDAIYPCRFFLAPSDVTQNPSKYGIKIETVDRSHRHFAGAEKRYSKEGKDWQTICGESNQRNYQINKLFNLLKGHRESYARGALFYVMHLLSEHKDKKIIHQELISHYAKHYQKGEKRVVITTSSKILDDGQMMALDEFKQEVDGSNRVIIQGGEPLLNKHLLEMVQYCFAQGQEIIIETDGQMLSVMENCNRFHEVGVSTMRIKVSGYDPSTHDAATGIEGSFIRMIEGVKNWKKLGGQIITTTGDGFNSEHLFEITKLMHHMEHPSIYY